MSYWKRYRKYILLCIIIIVSYHFYFLCLVNRFDLFYLLYFDFMMGVILLVFAIVEVIKYRQFLLHKKQCLQYQTLIGDELDGVDQEIMSHDREILEKQLLNQWNVNNDLQDYFSKWYHEVKVPLAASLLLCERIEDVSIKMVLKEQLEKMNQQLKNALVGCKVQGQLYDLKMKEVKLLDCIKISIKNNQFFLIRHHFEIHIDVDEDMNVYTDQEWFVYILDQIINNAIKYMCDKPCLYIYTKKENNTTYLFIEDNGEGIQPQDITRVFEKGYTGMNHHNGQYKSTGMGLYMVSCIVKKLGHHIEIESEYGKYTRVIISMSDHREFFNLT